MLQRIGLAQALIHHPRLVVLDEPTAGVDPAGSRKIRDLVLDLKSRGISVILSSHLLEQVQEICDRVGIVFRGRMVKEGPLHDLIAVEDQTEIVLQHATPALLARIQQLVAAEAAETTTEAGQPRLTASVVRIGQPRTTLETLFLQATQGDDRGETPATLTPTTGGPSHE
jgi:ABC-2 type transport system ATP-binding protein